MTIPCFNVTPAPLDCVDTAELGIEVFDQAPDETRIKFGTLTNRNARLCYYKQAEGIASVQYTPADTSGNYGAPGNEHIQTIPHDPNDPAENWVVIVQVQENGEWEDLSCEFVFTSENDVCVAAELHENLYFEEITTNSLRVRVAYTSNAPARVCYWPTSNPANVSYTPPELTGNFGGPDTQPHNQLISGLNSFTSYTFQSQTTVDGGLTWTDVSCPTEEMTNSIVLNHELNNEWMLDNGFQMLWNDTPQASDVGNPISSYFLGSWLNGQPVGQQGFKKTFSGVAGEGDQSDPVDTVQIDPIDGRPAVRAVIHGQNTEPGQLRFSGYIMRGNQLSLQGTAFRRIMFSQDVYIPELPIGIDTPGDNNGYYMSFGHHTASLPGDNQSVGGSTYHPTRYSVRVPMKGLAASGNGPGSMFIYQYGIREWEENQAGTRPSSGRGIGSYQHWDLFRGGWNQIALEVIPNSAPASSDGLYRLYVNGSLVGQNTNRMWGDMDMRWKGFGSFFEARYQERRVELWNRCYAIHAQND